MAGDSMALGSAYAEVTLKQGGAWNAVQASSINSLQAWNRRAMKLATVTLGVVGVAGIVSEVKKAIQVYADFEYAMAGVRAVTNATDADFKKLTESAKKLGTSTKFNMTQIAQAMEELGRAGFTTNQIIATMPGVTNLAAASTLSLSAAAETTMMTLKGMGLAASDSARVADVLAAADAASAVSVADLAESLKYITPLAKAAGFSLEETVAAAAALGDAGIKGTMAGTSLRFAFGELLSESDAFKERVGALGIEMSELYGPDGQLKDFADILTLFSEHGITAGEVMEMMGDRAGVAIINLTQNTPKLKELVATLENSAGAAKRVADIKLDTITGQLGILGSKWEALRVGLIGGTEDATKNFIKNTLIPFVDSIGEWFQKQGGLVGLWERFGDAVKYVGLAFAKIAGVVAILSLVYKALTGLTNPIIYLVALAAALYVAWETNFYGIRDLATAIWNAIYENAKTILGGLIDFVAGIFTGDWDRAWGGLQQIAVGAIELIKDVVLTIWDALPIPENIKAAVAAALSNLFDAAKNIVSSFFVHLKEVFGGISDFVSGVFTGNWKQAWQGIKDAASAVIDFIKESLSNVWDALPLPESFKNRVETGMQSIGRTVKAPLNFVFEATGADSAAEAIKGFDDTLTGVLASAGMSVLLRSLVDGLLKKATGPFAGVTKLGTIAILAVLAWEIFNIIKKFDAGDLKGAIGDLTVTLGGILGGILGTILGGGLGLGTIAGFALGSAAGYAAKVTADILVELNWDFINKMGKRINEVVKVIPENVDVSKPSSWLNPGNWLFGLGQQKGGPIPGEGLGDIIPAMLEPGEFVLPNWMMKIPWFSALVRGMWQKGKKMKEGGDALYQVGVPDTARGWLGLESSALLDQAMASLGKTVESMDKMLLAVLTWWAKGAKDQKNYLDTIGVIGKMLAPAIEGLGVSAEDAAAAQAVLEAALTGLEPPIRKLTEEATELQKAFDAIANQIILDYDQQIQAYTQLYDTGVNEGNIAKQYAGIAGLEGVFGSMDTASQKFVETGTDTEGTMLSLKEKMDLLAATFGFTSKTTETWAGTIDRLVAQLDPSKPEEMAQALQALGSLYETIANAMALLKDKGFADSAAQLQVLLDKIIKAGGQPLPNPQDAIDAANKAAREAQDRFMQQFGQGATDALASGDWQKAEAEAERLAADFENLVAAAAALPVAEGVKPITRADVLAAIIGVEDGVIGLMEAELKRLELVDTAKAKSFAAEIKAIQDKHLTVQEISDREDEAARKKADDAGKAFSAKFTDPILEAFGSGDWKGMLAQIHGFAEAPRQFIDALAEMNGELDEKYRLDISEVDVMRSLLGMEDDLIEKLQLRIDLARLAQQWDTVKELEEIKEWIEAQRKSPAQRRQEALGNFLGDWGGTISQAGSMAGVGGIVDAGLSVAEGFASGNPWMAIANVALDGIQWLADKSKEAADELKQTFSDVVSGAWELAQSFSGLITQTQLYQDVMEFGTELLGNLFEGFLGPLSDLFAEILTVFEETVETTATAVTEATEQIVASLNVPYGWKALNRIRYGASVSGEPPVFNSGTAASSTSTLEETAEVVSDIILEFGGEISLLQVALIDLREKFKDVWDDIRPALIEAALGVAWTFVGVMNDTVLPAIQLIVPSLQGAITEAGKVISALLLGLAPVIQTVIGAFGMVADFFTNTIGPSLETFFTAFGDWWSTEMDPFLQSEVFPKLGEVATFLWDEFTKLVNFLAPYVMPLLRDLWAIIEDFWDTALKPMIEEFGAWIREHKDEIMDFLKNKLTQALQSLEKSLGKLTDYLNIKLIDDAGKGIDTLHAIWESGSLSLFEKVGLLWQSNSASLWQKIGGSIVLAWQGLWDWVGDWGIWDMLGFAEGGVVPGPIGAPQLAVVHGGEYVIPVGAGAASSYSASPSGPVHIHVSVGGRDLGEVVMKSLKANNALQFGPALNPIGG